jgi:8-oxo-dGTP pyrophosphatase MutT (NUDIX family)
MSDKKVPSEPVPAATVLLLRPGREGGLEVFMVVRHQQIDFASGALVFPGGKVDKGDADPRLKGHVEGCDGMDEAASAFRVGAVRESFEECGVLLARPKGSRALVSAEQLGPLQARWQSALVDGKASIADMVEAENLVLACDLIVPYSHWVTPTFMPKRFDTWFFVAEAPVDHLAVHDGSESVDSVWISPAQALAELEAGKRTIIFPTRLNLMMLAESPDVNSALLRARDSTIKTVVPWIEEKDGRKWLTIADDAGYKVTRAAIDAVMRG